MFLKEVSSTQHNCIYLIKNLKQYICIIYCYNNIYFYFILPGNIPIKIQNLFFKVVLAKTAE